MPEAQIFISYRRDDAAGYARAVYDELATRFGAGRVFIDVDDIGAGQAFSDVIRQAVGASKVLIVLIGRRWRGEREGGTPRVFDEGDFVRMEVAAGLASGMRVIPVLLDGATMPSPSELPESLQALAGRNAIEIDNTRFAVDIDRLVSALHETLGVPKSGSRRKVVAWSVAGALIVIALVAAIVMRAVPTKPEAAVTATASAPASAGVSASAAFPDITGPWQADVTYDWPNSRQTERFMFTVDGADLYGSASFLGVPRGILEGSVDAAGLRFATRTSEASGGGTSETVHRYRGRVAGGEIRFVMQTEGGGSDHVPVEFIARRSGPASSPAR